MRQGAGCGPRAAVRRLTGEVDLLNLHAGCPPTQGMKYLRSKWMRDRSQAGNDS